VGSETLPSACYIFSDESSIPFYSTSNGYKNNVKGETVEVLSAKLMNLQQRNKTANQYTQEVEQMTKSLEGAYIKDGLSLELARSYSTRHADCMQ